MKNERTGRSVARTAARILRTPTMYDSDAVYIGPHEYTVDQLKAVAASATTQRPDGPIEVTARPKKKPAKKRKK